MSTDYVLLFTDIVNSTQLTEQLGDEAASRLWTQHDIIARQLIIAWRGREIDKSDGFLLLFHTTDDAVAFSLALHAALALLQPSLSSRAGIHVGPMVTRLNSPRDVALGAKPLELDGIGKALAARVMMLARGGQTLLSAPARAALADDATWRTVSHGHWRLKGLTDPIELFEVGASAASFVPPAGSPKAYRVIAADDGWTPLDQLRHGLPAERDSFVGRLDALNALAARFDDGSRLVSVLGVGGIGKTRLALRYARNWLGSWPGGAWFCDLSSAHSFDGIVHAVAQGLDVPLGKGDPVQQLGAAIAGHGECLLVIDNFEQVARHAEATLGAWLACAPQARLLVTTREVLGITGEQTLALAPMSIEEGSALFERRAHAIDSTYAASANDATALPHLIELLDRLPLAIELAAARVRVMNVPSILARMDQRFKLLVTRSGRRDRQATLRAALDWSWELLSAGEQTTLAQLSVFDGGFTLEAAQAVVDVDSNAVWVGDTIQALVEKSLVRRQTATRLDLLRTVKEYALERLNETTARAATERRHILYFANREEPGRSGEPVGDVDNMVSAYRRAVASAAWSDAAQLLAHCGAALLLVGPAQAVLNLAEELRHAPPLPHAEQAVVARALGNAKFMLGQTAEATDLFFNGLAHARHSGQLNLTVRLCCALAEALMRNRRLDDAAVLLHEALDDASRAGDPRLEYTARNRLGVLLLEKGEHAEAAVQLRLALEAATRLGDRRWQGGVLGNLGLAHYGLAQLDEAAQHFADAIKIGRSVGDRQWSANAQCNLAFLYMEQGRHAEAESEFRLVLGEAEEIGHSTLVCTVKCNLGQALLAQSRAASAAMMFEQAADLARHIGQPSLEAECREHLATAQVQSGSTP